MLETLKDFLKSQKVAPHHINNHVTVLIDSFHATSTAETNAALKDVRRRLYYIAETKGKWDLFECEALARYKDLCIWNKPLKIDLGRSLNRQCTVSVRDDGAWLVVGNPSWASSGLIDTLERTGRGWEERGTILPPDTISYNFGAKIRILNAPATAITVEYRKRTSCPSLKYTFDEGVWTKN